MIKFVRFFCLFVTVLAVAPDSLRLVNVVYRHGDRSPTEVYPTDPNKDKWPQGLGWLTMVGMQQQYALGQFLRSEYGSFLSPTYKNTEIVVAASNVNRCLMSAYCNLVGLYPPQGDQVWNPNLLWQPIPVHTRPEDEDHVLAVEENCPRYNELYNQELQSPAVKKEEKANAEFYKFLENKTGIPQVNLSDAWTVADALFCEKSHNYSLPDWAHVKWGNITVYEKLMDLSYWTFSMLFAGTELSRLKGGPLLKVFLRNMNKAAEEKQHYKMYMYSAHDTTVAAVSDAMKVFNQLQPPYTATLLVELHLVESDFCVKIRYYNKTAIAPYPLMHPDCQIECCPLDKFVEVTKSEVPDNWEAECNNKPTTSGLSIIEVILLILVVFTVGLMFFILICCIYRCKHRREYTLLPSCKNSFM